MPKKKKTPQNPKELIDQLQEDAVEQVEAVSGETAEPVVVEPPVEEVVEPPVEEVVEPPVEEVVEVAPKPKRFAPVKAKPVTLDKLEIMLKDYADTCNKPCLSAKSQEILINKLSAIIQFVVREGRSTELQAMYQFFSSHRSGLLSEEVVFRGINKLSAGVRIQMEVFYSAMIVCVANKTATVRTRVDLDRVRSILKNDAIVAFIAAKTR